MGTRDYEELRNLYGSSRPTRAPGRSWLLKVCGRNVSPQLLLNYQEMGRMGRNGLDQDFAFHLTVVA
jgi:hypothetical protein